MILLMNQLDSRRLTNFEARLKDCFLEGEHTEDFLDVKEIPPTWMSLFRTSDSLDLFLEFYDSIDPTIFSISSP